MKRIYLIIAIVALTFSAAICLAQEAEQVVDRAIEAMGGRENIDAVNSISLTFSGSFPGAPQMQLKVYHVRPGKYRYEWIASRGNRIEATDGSEYWSSVNQNTRDMSKEEREELVVTAEILTGGFFSNLAERGISISYAGMHMVDAINSDVVTFSAEGRTDVQWAFSVEDGLPHQMKRVDAYGENVLKISDFREVAGLLLARKIEIIRNGETVINLGVDVVEINVPLDEALFTRPK